MIKLNDNSEYIFNNNFDFCVGTGRMGLALQKEYMDQLALVQEKIGFKHIRGHGLFNRDMSIYQEYKNEDGSIEVEYNFTYLDMVFDNYLKLNIEPFIEFGFMPDKLASGEQSVFFWNGNVTPPTDYGKWCDLIQAVLTHLIERYGLKRVLTWPLEIWNEPNLPVFWKDADMNEYFKLFELTFNAIKEVNPNFKVGGPAVCGGSDEVWITAFMNFCEERNLDIDFVTRHHYTTELPRRDGHYGYPPLSKAEDGFSNLHTTRDIIDSHEKYKGLPIHITEYNTSYIPNAPLHDTTKNAAYLAHQLSRLGDDNESYSYWTFGDIFEEWGVPFSVFHGGFGLVANGLIPKPTFWTFTYYKKLLGGKCIYKDDNSVVLRMPDGSLRGVLWNYTLYGDGDEKVFELEVPSCEGVYSVITSEVNEDHANPLKVWHHMGEPKGLTDEQKEILRTAAVPFIGSSEVTSENGCCVLKFTVPKDAVTYFEFKKLDRVSDRGYDYKRVISGDKPDEEN